MKLTRKMAQRLIDHHPLDAATTLETFSASEAVHALLGSRPTLVARVLQSMSPHRAAPLLREWPLEDIGALLDAMPPETAAGLLRRGDSEFCQEVLGSLKGRTRRTLGTLLKYSSNSAATRMDPQVLALPDDLTVDQAMEQVRKSPNNVLFNLYVVDRHQVLLGVLNLRELLSSSPQARLRDVMKESTYRLSADAEVREILRHPGWREVHSLPVVDSKGRFLGALRYRTLQKLQRTVERDGGSQETISALGDLFWTGVAGALDALTSVGSRETQENEGTHESR